MLNSSQYSLSWQQLREKIKPFWKFIRKFLNDWSLTFAAMLAYNLLISLLPMVVAIFGVFGLVLKNYPSIQYDIQDRLVSFFPAGNDSSAGIRQVVDLALDQLSNDAGYLLIIGIGLALFGASRLFISIDQCLSIVYRLPERKCLRQNLLAIAMVLIFICCIPAILLITSMPSILSNQLPGPIGKVATYFGGIALSLFIGFILFEMIYFFIPNKTMTLQVTWCGSLVAACTLEIFVLLFPFYVRRFMNNYAGQIGFAVILLLFFYYFATILLLGAQINAFFFEDYQPFTEGLGTYISQNYQRLEPRILHKELQNKIIDVA